MQKFPKFVLYFFLCFQNIIAHDYFPCRGKFLFMVDFSENLTPTGLASQLTFIGTYLLNTQYWYGAADSRSSWTNIERIAVITYADNPTVYGFGNFSSVDDIIGMLRKLVLTKTAPNLSVAMEKAANLTNNCDTNNEIINTILFTSTNDFNDISNAAKYNSFLKCGNSIVVTMYVDNNTTQTIGQMLNPNMTIGYNDPNTVIPNDNWFEYFILQSCPSLTYPCEGDIVFAYNQCDMSSYDMNYLNFLSTFNLLINKYWTNPERLVFIAARFSINQWMFDVTRGTLGINQFQQKINTTQNIFNCHDDGYAYSNIYNYIKQNFYTGCYSSPNTCDNSNKDYASAIYIFVNNNIGNSDLNKIANYDDIEVTYVSDNSNNLPTCYGYSHNHYSCIVLDSQNLVVNDWGSNWYKNFMQNVSCPIYGQISTSSTRGYTQYIYPTNNFANGDDGYNIDSGGFPTWAIALIVLVVIAFCVVMGAVIFCCRRKRNQSAERNQQNNEQQIPHAQDRPTAIVDPIQNGFSDMSETYHPKTTEIQPAYINGSNLNAKNTHPSSPNSSGPTTMTSTLSTENDGMQNSNSFSLNFDINLGENPMPETATKPNFLDSDDINKLKFPNNDQIYDFDIEDFEFTEILEATARHQVRQVFYEPTRTLMAVKYLQIPQSRFDNRIFQDKLKIVTREIENLKKLSECPNIVDFYGLCLHEGQALLCMELMDMSLRDLYMRIHYTKQESVPENLVGHIFIKIVDALIFCRSKDVIHRDIKPNNILVNFSGEIKLCDFGESRMIDHSYASTHVGTIAYLPPERFENPHAKYDTRSDVWSLGITLMEIILGRLPYIEKGVEEDDTDLNDFEYRFLLQHKIKNTNFVDLISKNFQGAYSGSLCYLLILCMNKLEYRPKMDQLQETEFYKKFSIEDEDLKDILAPYK